MYYSFKIFPHFRLVKSTRTIHHNQLLLTKFGMNLQIIEPLTEKTGNEIVLFLVSRKTKSEIAKLL